MGGTIETDLRAWVRAQGGFVGDVQVMEGVHGRGLFATRHCDPGTLLVHVPAAAMFTAGCARASSVGRQLASAAGQLSELGLMAALLAERRRDGGPWACWTDSLPRSFPGHPVFYGPCEFAALGTVSEAARLAGTVRNLFLRDACVVAANSDLPPQDYAWAWACVKSRAFETSQGPAMVPFVDMLNHAPASNSRWACTDDGFRVFAARRVQADEEIVHSYGDLNNATLLAVYGFAISGNPHDFVVVGAPADRAFRVAASRGDAGLRALLAHLRALSLADEPATVCSESVRHDNERAALQWIRQYCARRLANLAPSTPADDASRTPCAGTPLHRMIGTAMDSERTVLSRLDQFATKRLLHPRCVRQDP